MSRSSPRSVLLLGACLVVLTGCGSSPAAPGAAPTTAAGSMSPGMVMPDGSTMGAHPSPAPDGPPALAVMVCDGEVRGDLVTILALPAVPPTSSTWVDRLYTCTYRLPVGPLVLTVKESADPAAALDHYGATRRRHPSTRDAVGLGEHAYLTPTGTVTLVKDSFTLTVDATGLPAQFGSQDQKRTDLAYEVATVVLGCWTGDDGH